jgi:hypothetical protein
MQPKVTYRSTRLHFKRAEIDPLDWNDEFRVVTPIGTWQMSKSDFYRSFPNVVQSLSYSGSLGQYHYTKPPAKSDPFKLRTVQSGSVPTSDLEQQLRRLEQKISDPNS